VVLLNTKDKGINIKDNVIPLEIQRGQAQPKEIPWNMSKQIKVGKRSDGYTIMQALAPLFEMGWSMHITKGENEPLRVQLVSDKGKTRQTGEGTTLSVALRRMSTGMSKQFSHMVE
jgi:hypothetical protein